MVPTFNRVKLFFNNYISRTLFIKTRDFITPGLNNQTLTDEIIKCGYELPVIQWNVNNLTSQEINNLLQDLYSQNILFANFTVVGVECNNVENVAI